MALASLPGAKRNPGKLWPKARWMTPSAAAAPALRAARILQCSPVDLGPGGLQPAGSLIATGQAGHPMAGLQQFLDDGRADESRGSGDENVHYDSPIKCQP